MKNPYESCTDCLLAKIPQLKQKFRLIQFAEKTNKEGGKLLMSTTGNIYNVCSACGNNSTSQSQNVVGCIDLFIKLLFYFGLAVSCCLEFWQRHKDKNRFFAKKQHPILALFVLSLIQLVLIGTGYLIFLDQLGMYGRQILYSSVFFYFLHKYDKLTESQIISKKISQNKINPFYFQICLLTLIRIPICYILVTAIQIGLLIMNLYGIDGTYSSNCPQLSELWLKIMGILIGYLFFVLSILFYKKISIQKQNLVSLFTIDKEQGIKNFLDQEDRLEELMSFVVVYSMAQFLLLSILIYYYLQMSGGESDQNCSLLPPSYLYEGGGDTRVAGEYILSYCVNIIGVLLPQIYLFNLFKHRKSRTDYTKEDTKELIENEELPNGFGRFIHFNYGLSHLKQKRKGTSNNDPSLSLSFLSSTE